MKLEVVPAYTYLSFGFFVPGMILILSGENADKNGEVKMNFVVYKPENVALETSPQTSKQEKLNSLNSLPSKERLPSQVEMEDWKKISPSRKISYDLSPDKERSEQDDRNISM